MHKISDRIFSLFSTLVLVLKEDLLLNAAALESISNVNKVEDLSAMRADFGDAGKSNENDDSAVPAGGAV